MSQRVEALQGEVLADHAAAVAEITAIRRASRAFLADFRALKEATSLAVRGSMALRFWFSLEL